MPKRMQSIQYSLKVFSIHSKYSVFTQATKYSVFTQATKYSVFTQATKYSVFTQATICEVREFEKNYFFLTQYVEIDNKLIDLHIDMV